MPDPRPHRDSPPSAWAVGLVTLASAFTLAVSLLLLTGPHLP